MKSEYDAAVNATYVTLSEGSVARTIALSDSVNVDVDSEGNPVGVEVLGGAR
jgi:uncharacterized protein YuzE